MEELREGFIQNKSNYDKTKLCSSVFLSFTVFLLEIAGAYLSNSLAIMIDTINCLSDLSIFLVALICSSLNKTKSSTLSFGYYRIEILAYLMTIALVWPLSIWVLYESVQVLLFPSGIYGLAMLVASIIGAVYNFIVWALMRKNQEQVMNPYKALYINMKTKHTHFLIDLIESIVIMSASIAIYFYPELSLLDPICAILIILLTLYTSVKAVQDIIGVLMEKTPVHIDLIDLRRQLRHIEGVQEMHDLHVWTIGLGTVYLSCHFTGKHRTEILGHAKTICQKFNIYHSIIQIEDPESVNDLNCESSLRL